MAPSRKTERELARLRDLAANDWQDQKEVLERAAAILREARRAGHSRRDDLESHVRPVLTATRNAAFSTREHFSDDVLPALSSVFGSALAIIDSAKDPQVRAALRRAGRFGSAAMSENLASKKEPSGVGRYILIGVGLVAIAGVAYAAWQTLRADDDLWIDDEDLTEQSGEIQPS